MHECPDCGQACDCDGEDLWNDAAARECTHGCEEGDDEGNPGAEHYLTEYAEQVYREVYGAPSPEERANG